MTQFKHSFKIYLSLVSIIATYLSANPSFAETKVTFSGNYRVIQAGCSIFQGSFSTNHGLSVGDQVKITATDRFFLVLANSAVYSPSVFTDVFHYRGFVIGQQRINDIFGENYQLENSAYVGGEFLASKNYYRNSSDLPLHLAQIRFSLRDDSTLEVLNEGRKCILERL